MNRRIGISALTALLTLAAPLPPAAAQATPRTPAGEVNAFFEEYRLAALGEIDEYPKEIRAKTLPPPLNAQLDRWSATHHGADPVFRAKNIPRTWSIRTLTTTTVAVTETWYEGGTQEVRFTVRPPALTITAINDPPGGSS
ncbi:MULTISPECIES: hypothetical protein [unclassified Kitasatospora]|uniref:hypothetical protein n=1 Tax=unclassified Kitasatospora TaxID=2633591 RepID=UPI000708E57A|nr:MULTISPECIES: hypothetical protein [unclassified Kitasatospora]KQV21792.1 hypothetical protein ASC99_19110 [Kitasatospora sp. Root107]KRB75416.1 hypothetical protein ASE03_15645 [Kitasatospora sp. Root187]